MKQLTESELDNLDINSLVQRMDSILNAPYWNRMGNDIMKLNVKSIFETTCVQSFPLDFQRKVIYKAFGLLLQLQYTDLSISAQFFSIGNLDEPSVKELHFATREQWLIVSSRIIFEYFMHLTYMLGTGQDFKPGKSAIKRYKNWLQEKNNKYNYFSLTIARALKYDRKKRSPEVHANPKLVRQVLLLSVSDIENGMFHLYNTMKNQWQFILDIANEQNPNGWAAIGDDKGDKEWYDLWESEDQDAIVAEIEKMFKE